MKSLIKSMILVSLAAGSAAAHAQSAPNLDLVGITHAGTGCPVGSLSYEMGEYRDQVAIRLSGGDFVAETGPGVSLSAGRKACQMLADVRITHGWQYRVIAVAYAGHAELGSGVSGLIRTSYYFQGQFETASDSRSLYGPEYSDLFDIADFSAQDVWSPCGLQRALNLKISASVRGSRGQRGMIAMDDPMGIDPSFILIETRRCQ